MTKIHTDEANGEKAIKTFLRLTRPQQKSLYEQRQEEILKEIFN